MTLRDVETLPRSLHEASNTLRVRSFGDRNHFHSPRAMPTTIRRTLAHQPSGQDRKVVAQDEITSFSGPVVILGDPGMGKTELTRELGRQPGMTYVTAGRFARSANPRFSDGRDRSCHHC